MARAEYAEQATDGVLAFLNEHYSWVGRPVSARRDNGMWLVEVDIGGFKPRAGQLTG